MSRQIQQQDLSLKWLELFEVFARNGSLQATADETGHSVSTVSHHLKNLEIHLGVELFNHARRPMALTPKGEAFLRNIAGALQTIRTAKAEASAGDVSTASYVRIGSIEDFDSDIIPELAVYLAAEMPNCDFDYKTNTSQNIIDLLRKRQLELGIAGSPAERLEDLEDRPLLRDPFVVVLPAGCSLSPESLLAGGTELPFLRFSANLIIARQIEAHLKRTKVSLANSFTCDSNQTLMAMVAAGAGWTITTPLLFSRAKRFQNRVKVCSFPGKSFSRNLTIIATPDCSRAILQMVDNHVRATIRQQVIKPVHEAIPWLREHFRLLGS